MKLYFDLAKERLLSVPRGAEIHLIHIKAGGSVELEIDFYNGKASTAPAFTPLIQFAIKTSEQGTLLALADTDDFTGSGAFYGGTLLTNTAEIVTWLDGASSKLAVAELTIRNGVGGIPIRSQTLTVRVANHVIRGDEVTPGTLPSADAYVAARAVLYDRAQTLSGPQKVQARANIGVIFPEYATLAAANAAIAAIGVVFYNLATSRHEVTTDTV